MLNYILLKKIEVRSSRRAILLIKYLFFFPGMTFFKEISRTHQVIQEADIVRKHMNFPGEDIILYQIFQQNQKWYKNTYNFFTREAKCTRTHQDFQKSFLKISQEHMRFPRIKKFHKNRSNFPGDLCPKFR